MLPPRDYSALLEPLEGLAIPPPFDEESHPFPTLSSLRPSTVELDLDSTPRAGPTVLESFVPPPAPAVKDLDSFSEGTAAGSFADFEYAPGQMRSGSEDDSDDVYDAGIYRPHADSIESWRDDVQRHAPPYEIAVELGRRRLPTPPTEEPANKRRRVSELPHVDARFVVRPVAVRARSLPPDLPVESNALCIELQPRFAILRPASAPPTLCR